MVNLGVGTSSWPQIIGTRTVSSKMRKYLRRGCGDELCRQKVGWMIEYGRPQSRMSMRSDLMYQLMGTEDSGDGI